MPIAVRRCRPPAQVAQTDQTTPGTARCCGRHGRQQSRPCGQWWSARWRAGHARHRAEARRGCVHAACSCVYSELLIAITLRIPYFVCAW